MYEHLWCPNGCKGKHFVKYTERWTHVNHVGIHHRDMPLYTSRVTIICFECDDIVRKEEVRARQPNADRRASDPGTG